jgi:pyrroloquinoline-quinone synthase
MLDWTCGRLPMIDAAAAAALSRSLKRGNGAFPRSPRGVSREPGLRRRDDGGGALGTMLCRLRTAQTAHPLWNSRLVRGCAAGELTRDDFRLFFSQYALYSQSLTGYLAALLESCEGDAQCARLSMSLFGGGSGAPERRHNEVFRRFLQDGLGVEVAAVHFTEGTRFFVQEYLDFCRSSSPAAGSAFLSLGTEAVVPRIYAILVDGMLEAGLGADAVALLGAHMDCEEEHAETLEQMMVSYARTPDWFDTCHRSMNYALSLRLSFFDQLYDAIEVRRYRGTD